MGSQNLGADLVAPAVGPPWLKRNAAINIQLNKLKNDLVKKKIYFFN